MYDNNLSEYKYAWTSGRKRNKESVLLSPTIIYPRGIPKALGKKMENQYAFEYIIKFEIN